MSAFEVYGVTPPVLYDDSLGDIMKLLATDPNEIVFETADYFKNIIHKHLGRVKALYFPKMQFFTGSMDWLNTSKNLFLDGDLKNKILILDFFTYCCINCIHILPFLKYVEEEYANNPCVAVIGIHTPKFPNEKSLRKVTDAIMRYNIKHPVVNDCDSVLWNRFNISCWPTVVILGPKHELLFILIGESEINKLPFIARHVIQYFASHGYKLNSKPLPLTPAERPPTKFDLLYPAGISTMGTYVLISDTGHNRLILFTMNGRIEEIIGTGKVGCTDGPFNRATFNNPRGTAWKDLFIYVADTGNHSIRKIDLMKKCVSTVFKGKDDIGFNVDTVYTSEEEDPLHKSKFRSPWDVCIAPKIGSSNPEETSTLYIAVAGSHQIWSLNLNAEDLFVNCIPCAGSGKEENRNNMYPLRAGFAQPSGIDYSPLSPFFLFVADSESSTIRSISLLDGSVKTIVGGGLDPLDLFQFGDVDGKFRSVKLQHPMGICVVDNDTLAITDTYNHKIKIIKIEDKSCFTYELHGSVEFSEPSAICNTGDSFFVADTNNHCIERVQILENDGVIFPIVREEVQHINISNVKTSDDPNTPKTKIEIKLGGQVRCSFDLRMDPRYRMSEEHQPWDVAIRGEGRFIISCLSSSLFDDQQPALVFRCDNPEYQERLEPVDAEITISATIPLCDSLFKTCRLECLTYHFIIECSATACKYANVTLNSIVGNIVT